MVYCGKPSKGCAPCRYKRTKCDLVKPSCTQCLRTGRVCGGYRVETEAHGDFRDQTQEVARKHSGQKPKKKFSKGAAKSINPGTSIKDSVLPTTEVQEYHSSPPPVAFAPTIFDSKTLEEGAASFFFNEYIMDGDMPSHPAFQRLPAMYRTEPATSALSNIITALGLSSISKTIMAPRIMLKANAKYAEALQTINASLRDPVLAKLDQTLMVVMLLGLYEENNGTSHSIEPWTNHVKGALALLEYRGVEQLERHHSVELINSIKVQVVINCLIRRAEVPNAILKWSQLARQYQTPEELSESELTDTMAKFCNLQAVIDSCYEEIDSVKIITLAMSIEADLISWSERWGPRNVYATVAVAKGNIASPYVFSDHWFLSSDIVFASQWNHYRSISILTNQIMVEQFARIECSFPVSSTLSVPNDYTAQATASRNNIVALSREICATLPYYMFHNCYTDSKGWESAYTPRNLARVKLVIWPLYVAGQSDFICDEMRIWIAEQLEKIGDRMGPSKSRPLGQFIRAKQKAPVKRWREIGGMHAPVDLIER